MVLIVKNLPANAGDIRNVGLITGLGESPGGRTGNPLWYSCLENSMDRGAWQGQDYCILIIGNWLQGASLCIYSFLTIPLFP